MIKVTGPNGSSNAAGPRRATRGGGEFRVGTAAKSAETAAASASAPVETLSALIALQSGERRGGREKTIAAARRALELLDRLRMSLLEGSASIEDLQALDGALAVPEPDSADAPLSQICDEIRLRARVELAKRGL